jgi:hypothetical protein
MQNEKPTTDNRTTEVKAESRGGTIAARRVLGKQKRCAPLFDLRFPAVSGMLGGVGGVQRRAKDA